ncbi:MULTISPECIES: hypothetical protein [Photorhabdus]|nr:hypothetical protein [Photorhabdus asymbiotica]
MTGVSECSQQRGNLKDDGYICEFTNFEQKNLEEIYIFIAVIT